MGNNKLYTTQLQAGLGVIYETRTLLELWQPGMKSATLYQIALDSGYFSNVTARRLRNIVAECFAPRYLVTNDYPAEIIKDLKNKLSSTELIQLFFLFTSRANTILSDFVKKVYWVKYAGGQDSISNYDAKRFVIEANQNGKTIRCWSDSTIKRVSTYLTGCCADFGLLEKGRKSVRKIIPFHIEQKTIALLAYDLHFAGLGDNALIAHPDWNLFGLQQEDLKEEMKRLSLKGFFITQYAGDVIRIGWNYKSWKELFHVIIK
ncbi:BrxA family protein [Desulfobacterium sp. N47]|uniref:DUF1819 domain-containing protein n=1 Tax=uncultured Desulfobacterium sp. TaxID=201089 RepID=E1Y8A3_9BACT|nr:hypothetical protein N47_A08260 [uncultured Desulfobacterium sp.]